MQFDSARCDIAAVLWDFDGTLTHRPQMWSTSIAEACWAIGVSRRDVTPEDFDANAYLHLPWNSQELGNGNVFSPDEWWSSFLRSIEPLIATKTSLAPIQIQAVLSKIRETATDASRFAIDHRAIAIVEDLNRRQMPQYILSNHVPELEAIVRKLLPGLFRHVWSSACIGFEKPRQEIFQFAIEKIGKPSASLLMIGDSNFRDIAPARLAGMKAAHIDDIFALRRQS